MKFKTFMYAVLAALFLTCSYFAYSYCVVALSFGLLGNTLVGIFASLAIFVITIFRGRQLPLHKVLSSIAMLNLLFVACYAAFSSIMNRFPFNETAHVIANLGALVSLVIVWYLQASLFFVKQEPVVKTP